MSSMTLAFLLFYLLIQLVIGYWISRRIHTDSDYFLAGRSLGFTFATISIFATWFGAETCMGSAGSIFENGLSGSRADPFGYTFCLVLMGLLLAAPLRAMNLVTLGDLFRLRYSRLIETLAVLILLPSTIIWSAAQIRALGQIVTVMAPIDFSTACILATAFVILYTSLGGLMGDVIHDVVQGGVLILGLGVLLFFSVNQVGGWEQAFRGIEASRWSFTAPGESFIQRLDAWSVPILGSLVAQELISRVLACRNATISRRASLSAASIYLFVGLIPVFIGLIGPQLPYVFEHKDQFLPSLAQQMLPVPLFVLFMGALIAAILSTVDSTLLTVSAFATHNLMGSKFYELSERRKLVASKVMVVVGALIAFVLAHEAGGIYELVMLASSFGTAGVLVITITAVWRPSWVHPLCALICLLVGMAAFPIANHLEFSAPFLFSIVAAILAYFLPLITFRFRPFAFAK